MPTLTSTIENDSLEQTTLYVASKKSEVDKKLSEQILKYSIKAGEMRLCAVKQCYDNMPKGFLCFGLEKRKEANKFYNESVQPIEQRLNQLKARLV